MVDKKYLELADRLIEENKDRNKLFKGVDDVFYHRWELPEGMPDWVQKVVSSDGHDAVMTATRVMSQWQNLRIKVAPIPTSSGGRIIAADWNRDRANEIEAALKWNLHQVLRKTESSLLWEAAFSSVQYAMPAIEVVYLPYQEKILEGLKKDTKRIKALKKRGDFTFIAHNPANVYPLFSMYGLEGVLKVKIQKADTFVKEWANLSSRKEFEDDDEIAVFDWWDYDKRVVWGMVLPPPGSTSYESGTFSSSGVSFPEKDKKGKDVKPEQGFDILEMENELGFIPISVRRWGNSMSSLSKERYTPLLGSMFESKQWDMLNTFASLDTTLAWKRAAMPVGAHTSATDNPIELDASEPVGILEMGPGDTFQALPAQSVDRRVEGLYNDYRNMVWQSTIARSLQSLDFPSRTAYSSINQVLSAAAASLAPYKTLTEWALADICHLMLCFVSYYGDKYETVDLYGQYGGEKAGRSIRIPSDTIEPDAIQITATMTPDVPLDEQAKANTAVLLRREFRIPEEYLLEEMGIDNPKELMGRRYMEDYQNAFIDLDIQKMALEMQEAVRMQSQMMQMQQQAQMQAAQSTDTQGQPITEPSGGMGGNPAAGGRPPVQAVPGQGIPR